MLRPNLRPFPMSQIYSTIDSEGRRHNLTLYNTLTLSTASLGPAATSEADVTLVTVRTSLDVLG